MHALMKQKLIAAIYAATLSPLGFNELVDDLSDQVAELIADLTGVTPGAAAAGGRPGAPHLLPPALADLAQHIASAAAIQARLSHVDLHEDRIRLIVETAPNPAFVFDGRERIVAANARAEAELSPLPETLAGCLGNRDHLEAVRAAVAGFSGRRSFASVPLLPFGRTGHSSCALVKRIGTGADGGSGGALYLLAVAEFSFGEEVRAGFRDTYGLTDAEAHVAVLLADGESPEDIAGHRNVALNTVRTQIKSVKHKTGVRDLPQLVRLLCGYSAGILGAQPRAGAEISPLTAGTSAVSRAIVLAGGRRLEYLEQGARDGRPVLLLHNLPYGAVFPEAAIAEAVRRGLRIIAPLRPGHGRSDPLPGRARMGLLDQAADDLRDLVETLGLGPAVLLGNVGGAAHAVHFAHRFPRHVTRLVLVSRAPVWREVWMAGLPQRQKLISLLLRHVPPLANVLVWAILSYVNREDGGDFVRRSVKESKADLRALDDPETLRLIVDGIRFGLVQGPDAFCREWELQEIDMTAEARALSHPIHILQGADDPVTRPDFTRAFVEAVPAATLELIEGAGNFLFYSHWARVLARL